MDFKGARCSSPDINSNNVWHKGKKSGQHSLFPPLQKGGGGILGFQTGASEVSEGEIFSEILVGDKKQGFNVLW